ncbi:tetratricopeptide repeat protein [Azospirillum sp. YIM DDC1]|uniref:Tetratricopeptide repeat protein n=1 Tax=Azospirillum aestuarii TaxID=2802052 RepID=A0ABS1HVF8_9PROT|nr:tetratricopeptide repeat protein [Azospirillum aestuarii]MBK4718812.1 tetratricopeptide repeat protein [Azospirillum aestuarii]
MATLQEALLIAFDLQREGRFAEADSVYGQILDAVPGHPPALHLRGLLLAQCGRLEEGCALVEQAIAEDGSQPDLHANHASLLEALGRFGAAAEALARAAALDPERVALLNNFAVRRLAADDPAPAEQALRAAVDLRPGLADPRINRAQALDALGRTDEALAQRRIAALLAPDDAALLGALALRPDATEADLRRALRLDPERAALWNRLGAWRKDRGALPAARHAYERGLALDPADAALWNNRANVLKGQGDPGGAREALRRAAAFRPDSAAIRNNLSDAHMLCGDPAAALAEAEAALARDPALADARLARAAALLALGRFAEGWDAWEDRWSAEPWCRTVGRFPQPLWTGQPLGGGRLLVWGEQGVGDEVMFATLFPLLTQSSTDKTQSSTKALAGCLLECDARLAPLFARSLPGVEVVPRGPLPDPRLSGPDIAAQIPSGSLPRLLLRGEEDFRRLRAILAADPARMPAVRRTGRRPLVGIAWHTTNPKWGRLRNVPLADLARTLHAAGVDMVVLQYGDCAGEVAALVAEGVAIALPPGLDRKDDLDGLAAQIAATDLVVTIDNATAHLAGALGHPVWLLLSHAPDWRWLIGRDDSPWYPSARLFRQPAAGDWRTPLDAVADRLRALFP